MSSSIYTGIPTNDYVSGFLFSFAPNTTPTISGINNVLLVGQANSAVSAAWVANTPNSTKLGNAVIAADTLTVATTYGLNSMISKMYTQYRQNDTTSTVYLLPLPDTGLTAVSYTYTWVTNASTWTATTASTLNAYVAGSYVSSSVYAGDTIGNVITNLCNAINANYYLPCTANCVTYANSANSAIQITAAGLGGTAGDIDFRLNYLGAAAGEVSIPGIHLTLANASGATVSGGSYTITAGDPDPTNYLLNLPPIEFDVIVSPYTNGNSMPAYSTLLNQTSGRWSYNSQLFGFVFSFRKDTFANLVTFGQAQNNQFVSVLGMQGTPTTIYEAAAAYGGAATASLSEDVGVPLQAISLNILPPALKDQFTSSEGSTLIQNGMAYATVGAGNTTILNRASTTYQYNAQGIYDTSYKDSNTLFVLSYVIRTFRATLSNQYARCRLVDVNTPIPFGSSFTNVNNIAATAVAVYQQLNDVGYVGDVQTFIETVVAQDAGNGRVNLLVPLVLASPLVQLAVRFLFSFV